MSYFIRFVVFFFILLTSGTFSLAQVGSLKVTVSTNKEVANSLYRISFLGYLYKGKGTRDSNTPLKDFDFPKSKLQVTLDSLPIGSYTLVIRGSYSRPHKGFLNVHHLGFKDLSNVMITKDSTANVKIKWNDCIYHKHLENNICPKCRKADMVLPIVYGDTLLDPFDPKAIFHFSWKEETGCDPSWYCKRDKLEF